MPVPHEHREPLSALRLPLSCPHPECASVEATIAVVSASIATFRCTVCGFMWSAEIMRLPESVRELIRHSSL
jgi:hypothetical protein